MFALFLVVAAAVRLMPRSEPAQKTRMAARPAPVPAGIADATPSARGLPETDSSEAGPDGAGEERREREEAALVDAFDELVDKGMEPAKDGGRNSVRYDKVSNTKSEIIGSAGCNVLVVKMPEIEKLFKIA